MKLIFLHKNIIIVFILSLIILILNSCLAGPQYRYGILIERGNAAHSQGNFSTAEEMYGNALNFATTFRLHESSKSLALYSLGRLFRKQGRYEEAEKNLLQALAIQEKFDPNDHARMTAGLAELGRTYYFQGRYQEAVPLMKRALSIFDKEHPTIKPEHVHSIASFMEQLVDTLRRVDRQSEADEIEARIRNLISKDGPLAFDDSLTVSTIPIGMDPTGAAFSSGIVWVSHTDGNVVSRIDADAMRAEGDPIPVGKQPTISALTQDALWVVNLFENTVSRIDLHTHQVVATIIIGGEPGEPRGIAAGAGAIWVANSRAGIPLVTKIDPQTSQVIANIPLGKPEPPIDKGIAVGGGAVWVPRFDQGAVARIDPKTNQIITHIPVGGRPTFIAYGAEAVWVSLRDDSSVSKIDPKTNSVVATITTPRPPSVISVGHGIVWVTSFQYGIVFRIDPELNQLIGNPIRVGFGALSLVTENDSVWIVNRTSETLSHIDLERTGM